jgi:DNA-binding beta-propeller fold protein YncE
MKLRVTFAALILIAAAFVSSSQPPPREQVGPLADGGFLLNTGWRVKPAGVQIPLDTLPMSALLSKDGRFLVALNGGYNPPSLSVLDTKDGHEVGRTPVADAWLGLAFSPNGRTLWVGGGSQASVYEFSFDENGKLAPKRTFEIVKAAARSARDFIGDVAADPDGHLLYACDLYHDAIVVVNAQSGIVIDRFKTGRRPYRILFDPDGKSFYVTSWADGSLYHHQTSNGTLLQTLRLGAHPTDMVWRERATRAEEGQGEGAGFKARIFVSAANTNTVYAAAVSDNGDLRVLETINVATTPDHPLGMTPSALALSPDQSHLYVVCSGANAVGVVDVTAARSQVLGFIPTGWYPTAARALADGRLVVLNGKGSSGGSASFIPALIDESLATYTAEVKSNSPYSDEELDAIPAGIPPAIQHVIYIVEGAPESTGANHRKLAREFVTFPNFYANGDDDAEGLNWSTSAIANDYVEKMAPSNSAGRNLNPGFEGGEPAALPPAGYLWTNAAAAGISMRNYGFWVVNQAVLDSTLAKVTNLKYGGAQVFLDDLAAYGSANQMPALIMLRLGRDQGADQALGTIVEAVSRSKFWGSTAIFVVQAFPQKALGRSSALLISPYTHTGATDSNMYNTTSVLRTMELILHLRPMTHFDAGALPMAASFSQQASPAPYQAAGPAEK